MLRPSTGTHGNFTTPAQCVRRPDIDQLVQEKRACSPGSLEAGLVEGEAFHASFLRGLTRRRV